MENYRTRLIQIVRILEETDIALFDEAINIVMENELKETTEIHEIGEIVQFNLNVLLSSDDINVQKVAELILKIGKLKESLINLNKITEEELD
jgi:hypothetical protein